MDWARILGGFQKYLAEYARQFAAAGFSRRKDLYIASGLLSYNASKEMTDMLKFLEPHSRCGRLARYILRLPCAISCGESACSIMSSSTDIVLQDDMQMSKTFISVSVVVRQFVAVVSCRSVQYKELYIPAASLQQLNPEQEALVDFLVLANSDNFVGLGSSTFSVYLRCVSAGVFSLQCTLCLLDTHYATDIYCKGSGLAELQLQSSTVVCSQGVSGVAWACTAGRCICGHQQDWYRCSF